MHLRGMKKAEPCPLNEPVNAWTENSAFMAFPCPAVFSGTFPLQIHLANHHRYLEWDRRL